MAVHVSMRRNGTNIDAAKYIRTYSVNNFVDIDKNFNYNFKINFY